MQNDYLTVMLLNMVAGLVLLGVYLVRSNPGTPSPAYSAGFLVVGLVALATGLHMTLTWPLPGRAMWANISFGEPTLMLGALFLGAALASMKGWSFVPLGIVSVVFGVVALTLGIVILALGLTKVPALAGAGFILTGLAGILLLPAVATAGKTFKWTSALGLFLAAAIWAFIGLGAYVSHIKGLIEK